MPDKPCSGCSERDARIAQLQIRNAELERFQGETAYFRAQARSDRDLRELTGDGPAMRAVRRAIQQVADTDSTVLIVGETGTGKELVARAIHQRSGRREFPFVAVNCGALAPGIVASELFGHEPGAFTGATKRRIGRFELADRGTLLLDEIGDLPSETQVMILRALQERVIDRVGGDERIRIDTRVIAATHQDLNDAIRAGRFRADLFFRLNVFPIHVPPLRERADDIPDLVRHFVQHVKRRMNSSVEDVSREALQSLKAYPWPGNVRELENIVERAMIVSHGRDLQIDPLWLKTAPLSASPVAESAELAAVERRAIESALASRNGKIYGPNGAAAALGLKPTTLYSKMRKHHISRLPQAAERNS